MRSSEGMLHWVSLSLFVIGTVGYFSMSRDHWLFYAASHIGALGVMGMFGIAAGIVAKKKHRSYMRAFLLGSLLPIVIGMASVLVLLLGENGRLYCGGSVSLAVALVVVILYLIIGRPSRSRV